jgi:threonine dehydratase
MDVRGYRVKVRNSGRGELAAGIAGAMPIATGTIHQAAAFGVSIPEIDPLSGVRLPTMADVSEARQIIAQYLSPTPMLSNPALDALLGFQTFLKCENLQPVGAFKVRGGLFLMSDLSPEDRARGAVTASTGNHGQSIAYAAREFGTPATVWMPEEANPLKVASMRRLGADVRFAGRDFDESRAEAERDAATRGALFVASANDWRLIAGVATYTVEMLEAVPELDALIVPAGGGSGLAGACLAGKSLSPRLRIIGVQAAGAPVVYKTWRSGQLEEIDRADTFAEGLATRVAFSLPAQILWRRLDDFRLVTDGDLRRAILTLLERARVLAEGAGAAGLAAAYAMREELVGQKVGIVVSGGNLTLESLTEILAMEQAW